MPLQAKPILASLALQKVLYFNRLFSFLAFACLLTALAYKTTQFENVRRLTKILGPIVFSLWSIMEPFRLNLGVTGNLKEKVPDISAFLLVTIFPNLPLVALLAVAPGETLPIERLLGWPLLAFTIVEIFLAYAAVTSFVRSQTAQFYRLVQEDAIAARGGVVGAEVGGSAGVPPARLRAGVLQDARRHRRQATPQSASQSSDTSSSGEEESVAGRAQPGPLRRRHQPSRGRGGDAEQGDAGTAGDEVEATPRGRGQPVVTMSDILREGTARLAGSSPTGPQRGSGRRRGGRGSTPRQDGTPQGDDDGDGY